MTFRKASVATLELVMALAICIAAGQAQGTQPSQPSVADAARKARDQQKNQAKTGKVFTDDDVANLKGVISVVGSEPAPPPANAAAPAGQAKPAASAQGEVKDEAYWRKKFADARRTLADDAKELDVLQREYNLKQQQFYSNPNVALREQYSRKDLDDTQAQINAKKQDVDKDNQTLSDLQDGLRTSGGEPGWSNENSQPAAQSSAESQSAGQSPSSQSSPAAPPSPSMQTSQPGTPSPSQPQ